MTLDKVTKCPWPLAFINDDLTSFSYFKCTIATEKWKKNQLFPFKCLWNQNWPCHKIGQGQLRVMIYINFVVLQMLMLHAKFQGNWPSGSGEEDFLRFWFRSCSWQRFVCWLYFGHVTWIIYINYLSPFPRRLHIKFGFDRSSGFRGEDVWKVWTDDDDRRLRRTPTDDGCRTMGIL